MIISLSIILSCLAILFLLFSKKQPIIYTLIVATVLSGLFLCYTPGREEDLYRHYMIFRQVSAHSTDLSYYGNIYLVQSPGYIVLLYLLSFFNNTSVLPFFTGAVCYGIYIYLIYDISRGVKNYRWIMVFCICLVFIDIRFMDITGIRNILSSSLFALAAYWDLVKRKKKAFIVYIIAGSIHGVAILYFFLRCILFIYNKYNKTVICALLVFSAAIISNIAPVLENMSSGISFISELFTKINYYINTGGLGISKKYMMVYTVLYVLVLLLVYVIEAYFDPDDKFRKLSEYINIFIFFTFGFIGQREMFNRARMVILPFMFMYLMKLLTNVGGRRFLSICVSYKNKNAFTIARLSAAVVWGITFFTMIYFYILSSSDYKLYDRNFHLF